VIRFALEWVLLQRRVKKVAALALLCSGGTVLGGDV